MKKIIVFLIFCVVSATLFSQDLPSKTNILQTMQKVNNAWMQNNPETENTNSSSANWLEGTYYAGHMALFELFPSKDNITHALRWGINEGILDSAVYMLTVTNAWNAMVSTAVHPNGRVGYVQGVADKPSMSQAVTYNSFRDYGDSCLLLAGTEVIKLTPSNGKHFKAERNIEVFLEYEKKITDYGLFFDGDHVTGDARHTRLNRTDGKYDYAFGRRITPHGDCIAKHGDYVFVTWYRGGKEDRHVMLTRINMVTKSTVTIEFPHRHTGFQNRWHIGESHNTIAVGVSPKDGTVHLLYDMHAYSPNRPANGSLSDDYFRYSVSQKNAATLPDDEFTLDKFYPKRMYLKEGENYQGLTYPDFFVNDNDDLFVKMRVGGHDNGKFHMAKYDGTGWSSWNDYNILGAGNHSQVDYNWGLYGSYQYLHGKFRIAYSIRKNHTDIYQYNNGIFYSYSNDPDGRNQWFNYKGEAVSSPIINPYEAFVSEPGDEVPSGGNNSVTMTSSPLWTVTERGDIHFISNNVRGVGARKDVHTFKAASDFDFSVSTNVPTGDELISIGDYILFIGLQNGRPYIRMAPGGTNDWTVLYQANSGKTFRHGNVLVADGKIYYYLMENSSGNAQPIYLQVYNLATEPGPVAGVSVSPTSLSLTVNQTTTLFANVFPANAINKEVSWSSSNSDVATVNQSGVVTTHAVGSATITVTTADGDKTATCDVTVNDIPPGGISIYTVDAEQEPNVAENLFDGDTGDDSRWSAQGFPKSVTIDYGSNRTIVGTKVWTYQKRAYQYTVEASTSPTSGYTIIVNRTDNTSSAQPISNTFAPVTARYVRLTVTGASGYTSNWVSINEFEIVEGTPGEPVTGVSVVPTSLTLAVNETDTLSAIVLPSDATNISVSWSTSNPAIATVSQSGVVTAEAAGSAIITVTTNDGDKTATCAVTVNDIPSGGISIYSFDAEQNYLNIYPNPASSVINIDFTGDLTMRASVRIYNLLGGLVYVEEIDQQRNILSVSHLAKGAYIIRISSESFHYNGKIMVQ